MGAEVKKLKRDAYNDEEAIIVPSVDIYETENDFVLKADMPGVRKENLNITLDRNELEIRGTVDAELKKADNLKYRERTFENYYRIFTVGEGIDAGKITAALDNGVLTLVLPKSERVKPRKIEVQSA